MNRETCISGERTVTPTGFYLHLLSCENNNNKLIKYLEDKIKELEKAKCIYENKFELFNCFQLILVIYQNILERVKSANYE